MKQFRSTTVRALAGAGLATVVAAAAAACGASSDNAPDTGTSPQAHAGGVHATPSDAPAQACPLALAGATSSIDDTVDGVVVNFSVPKPGDLPELRRRVDLLAQAHASMHAGESPAVSGAPEQGPAPDVGAGAAHGAVDASASVEASDHGVKLVLRPADPAQLDSMRDRLRKQADDLVKSACKQAAAKTTH